jgi:hypothetical protein
MWVPSWASQIGVSWGKPFRFIVASVAVTFFSSIQR